MRWNPRSRASSRQERRHPAAESGVRVRMPRCRASPCWLPNESRARRTDSRPGGSHSTSSTSAQYSRAPHLPLRRQTDPALLPSPDIRTVPRGCTADRPRPCRARRAGKSLTASQAVAIGTCRCTCLVSTRLRPMTMRASTRMRTAAPPRTSRIKGVPLIPAARQKPYHEPGRGEPLKSGSPAASGGTAAILDSPWPLPPLPPPWRAPSPR